MATPLWRSPENTQIEYCFTVVAVEGSSAATDEVCTTRAADRAEQERLAEEEAAAEEEAEEEEAEEDPSTPLSAPVRPALRLGIVRRTR